MLSRLFLFGDCLRPRTADGGLTLTLRHGGLTIDASRRLAPEVLRRLGG